MDLLIIIQIVLDAPSPVRVALVSPGGVYGIGTGAVSTSSIPIMTSPIVHRGAGFIIGTGVSTLCSVHILDLARLFVLLVGEALKPNGGIADWGAEGYYFAVADEATTKDRVRVISRELYRLGHIKTDVVDVLSIAESQKIHPFMGFVFGSSARAVASRARKLGWKPVEAGVLESMATDIAAENPRGSQFIHWPGLGL